MPSFLLYAFTFMVYTIISDQLRSRFRKKQVFWFVFFSCFNRFLFQVLELTTTENINFLEEFRKSTSLIFQNIGNNKGKKKNQLKQHQQTNKKATIKWRKIDITPPTTIFCNDKNNKLITNTKHGIAPLMHKILHVYSSHWKSSISWYLLEQIKNATEHLIF